MLFSTVIAPPGQFFAQRPQPMQPTLQALLTAAPFSLLEHFTAGWLAAGGTPLQEQRLFQLIITPPKPEHEPPAE